MPHRRLVSDASAAGAAERLGGLTGGFPTAPSPSGEGSRVGRPAPRHVLVVDDDDHIREVAQVSLEAVAGWQVSTAACGREGVDLARAARPDAIVLDVMMPDLDGPATLARLRADAATRDVPVVFLTAKTQAFERARLGGLGAAGVLAKPFDPMLLAQEITTLLGWRP